MGCGEKRKKKVYISNENKSTHTKSTDKIEYFIYFIFNFFVSRVRGFFFQYFFALLRRLALPLN
jgi:hypothetical protein